MLPGTVYQVGKDHTGTLEKKNAFGMWSKKFVILTGLKFSICDSEGAAANQSFEMANVIQAENGDPTLLTVKSATDSVVLKGDRATADQWYELCRTALEVAGKLKPRNFGLPAVDPRYNLKFVEIPVEYRHRFVSLETAVIYWFAMTKKYGAQSKLTSKFAVEERVLFAGDKAIYVTKPNSEVTRCMKISMMKNLYTNLTTKKAGEELFMVIKMEAPDYDLYFAAPEIETLIPVLQTLYRAVTKGRELTVRNVNAPTDASVGLQLTRPEGFSMAMVVPTTKGPLKKALDDYAAKHGIQLTSTGTAVKATPKVKTDKKSETGTPGGTSSVATAGSTLATDDLGRFLKAIGLSSLLDLLKKQMVDLDVLEVMDEDDFINFGIPAAQARIIKERTTDADFMAAVRSGEGLTSPMAAPTSGGGSSGGKQVPISLSDDDEDLLVASPGRKPSVPPQQAAAPISFADLDLDDFEIEAPSSKSFSMKIVLDSDDDLDLPPPPNKPKENSPLGNKPALELDDI